MAEVVAHAEQRFEGLVRRHARAVRAAVARVGGRAGRRLADDIEQRVFLEIWKQVSREQEIENPSSYIYRAAVRETVRALREEQRRGALAAGPDAGSPPDENEEPSGAPTPSEVAESRELGRRIHEVLATLAPERRRAVRAHLAGLGVQELMRLEGWPYNKARNLIQRGMADLRQRLLERGVHA